MKNWDIKGLDVQPHSPEILSSTDDARVIVLEIPAGGELDDHQVYERAWVTVIEGEVEFSTAGGDAVAGSTGLMVEFAPGERHAVRARTKARILLLLAPWPGDGHPGALTIEEKARVREQAADQRSA